MTTFKLQQQQALKLIQADLQPYTDNKIIGEIVAALENPLLTWTEGNAQDKENININARNKLLHFIEHEKQTIDNKPLFLAIFNSLMIFANYWPLNDYKESETGYCFICPISLEELNENNKILLPSGTLIAKEILSDFLLYCKNKKSYADPTTRQQFKNGCEAFLKIHTIEASNLNYQQEKFNKLKSAALSGLKSGALKGFTVTAILLLYAHAIVPVILAPLILVGTVLLYGIFSTIVATTKAYTEINTEDTSTLQERQQQERFENSLEKIKTQASTQTSTQTINQTLHLPPPQMQIIEQTSAYIKPHAWKNQIQPIREPQLIPSNILKLSC